MPIVDSSSPTRRELLAMLAAAAVPISARYLLLEIAGRRRVAAEAPDAEAVPPGSTIKPIALTALLASRKLNPREVFPCPGMLTIAGRQLNCSHPTLGEPVRVDTAIAYSCNCFVAQMAERFSPGELADTFDRAGLTRGVRRLQGDAARLQALGEAGVLATPADLAGAYRWLSRNAPPSVLAGLEGAVEFGTARLAAIRGAAIAGKTGTVLTAAGNRMVWFAGFAPSRAPKVAIAVMMPGASGGGDAAPVARGILLANQAAWI